MLSMWSLNRDNPGAAGQLSNFHTGIPTMSAGWLQHHLGRLRQ
jgi:hypothetical protein